MRRPRLTVALTGQEAAVIGLHVVQPTARRPICSACRSGYLGDDGVFCRQFNEVIYDERTAAQCEAFEAS